MAHNNKKIQHITLTLLLAALLAAGGCSKTDTSQKLMEEARTLHQKGDNAAAVIQLKNALQKNPENGEARYLLGVIYNERGEAASAEKELRRALQFKQDPAKVLPALGKALLAQGQFQKVLDELDATPDKGMQAAALLILRGNAQLALRQPDAAKAAFDEAVKRDNGNAEAYMGMARLAMHKRDMAEALRQIELALDRSPRNAEAWLMKGDLVRAQAKKGDAEAAYRQALQVEPNKSTARLQLASMFLADAKYDAARSEISTVRKAEPKNLTALYMQALIDFRQGKYQAAHEALQELHKAAPNSGLMLSGAVAFSLGNYEQADKELGEFLKQNPGHVFASRYLAATKLKLNQPSEALVTLRPLLEKNTQDEGVFALAGEAYLQNREFAKATELFEKAASINPKSTAVRTELALSKFVVGKTEEAISELETASGLDTSGSRADIMLVAAFISKKEFDKALAAVAAFEKKQPDNPMVYNLKGAAYLGKKDRANARKSFEKALAVQPTYFTATINLAQMDLDENNLAAARKRFEDVLSKDRSNQQAMLSLAVLALREKQEKDYVIWLEKAAKTNTSALKPRMMLAQYYLEKREPQKALSMAREAQSANPNSLEALDILGMAQLASNEKDNALATYSKLATLAPKSALVYFRMATVQAAMKNTDTAKVSLAKALELKPGDLEILVAMVALESGAKRFVEAQKAAQLAQKNNPSSPIGFVLEGDVFVAQKQYPQAAKLYEKAFSVGKSGALAIKLHDALRLAGNGKEAETRLLQWAKEHPDDLVVRNALAQGFMSDGRYSMAVEQYQYLLSKNPKNSATLNNLAWLYGQLKDPRALGYAEQANKLAPGNPNILDTLGWVLVQQGQSERGINLLQQALSKMPDAAEIQYHLAAAFVKAGDQARGRTELERLLASGVTFPQEQEARALLKQLQSKIP